MEQVIKMLEESPVVYLGTVNKHGLPHVRPVALTFYRNKKFYFSTSNKTSLYHDLMNNPFVEISVTTNEFVWIRVSAKAIFIEDEEVKKSAIQEKTMLENLFTTADNPDFNMFYLKGGIATIYDYSGEAPKTWRF
jgi:uncharacterized pyridoxamine 5'-phosphate oxidase family protein